MFCISDIVSWNEALGAVYRLNFFFNKNWKFIRFLWYMDWKMRCKRQKILFVSCIFHFTSWCLPRYHNYRTVLFSAQCHDITTQHLLSSVNLWLVAYLSADSSLPVETSFFLIRIVHVLSVTLPTFSINNKLHQPEAAYGVLQYAMKNYRAELVRCSTHPHPKSFLPHIRYKDACADVIFQKEQSFFDQDNSQRGKLCVKQFLVWWRVEIVKLVQLSLCIFTRFKELYSTKVTNVFVDLPDQYLIESWCLPQYIIYK